MTFFDWLGGLTVVIQLIVWGSIELMILILLSILFSRKIKSNWFSIERFTKRRRKDDTPKG